MSNVTDYTIFSYSLYLLLTIAVILRAGHALHKSGLYFLVRTFKEESLANSINNLLLVGYYLLNIAYVLLMTQAKIQPANLAAVFEVVATKSGGIILLLAVVHYFNLMFFYLWKEKNKKVTLY